MPINYDPPAAIATTLIKTVDPVGIVFHAPKNGQRTLTIRFESLNGSGVFVERREYTVPLNDLDVISDPDFGIVAAALKRVAAKIAVRAGYPAGGNAT
jgi:hypothetical protein